MVDGPSHHHWIPGSHLRSLFLLPSYDAEQTQRQTHAGLSVFSFSAVIGVKPERNDDNTDRSWRVCTAAT